MDTDIKIFPTSDLGLATYLHCIGAHLESIDHKDPRRSLFLFRLTTKQAEALVQWQSGSAKVNALAFWNSYQTVKARLFRDGVSHA